MVMSEADDNPGNGYRQCAAGSPTVWVLYMRDTAVKEMIAKPALSLRGLVIRMTNDMQYIAMSS